MSASVIYSGRKKIIAEGMSEMKMKQIKIKIINILINLNKY